MATTSGPRAGRHGLVVVVAACLLAACGGPSVTVAASSLASAADDPASGVEVFADPDVASAVIAGNVTVDGADDDEAVVNDVIWRTLAGADDPWPVLEALDAAASEQEEVAATYRGAIAAGLGARAAELDDRVADDEADERWSDIADLVIGSYDGEGAGVALVDGAIETLLVRISPAVMLDYFDEDHNGAGTELAFASESYSPWVDLLRFARFEAEIARVDARRWLAAAADLEPQGQREPIPPARFTELAEVEEGLDDDEGPTPSEIATLLEVRVAAHLFEAVPELRVPRSPVPDAVETEDVVSFAAVDEVEQLVTIISRLVVTRLDDELGRR